MPQSVGSAAPSNGGRTQELQGQVQLLRMQMHTQDQTLAEHLSIIQRLLAAVHQLERTVLDLTTHVHQLAAQPRESTSSHHRRRRHRDEQ